MINHSDNEQGLLSSRNYQEEQQIQNSVLLYNTQSQYFNRFGEWKEKLPTNIADIDHIDQIITILEKTFQRGNIYLDLGYKNLISLNPFKKTEHLSDSLIQSYKKDLLDKNNQQQNNLSKPPHLYKFAENAQQACFSSGNSYNTCSILTQGISGSGKTVASKSILDYIAANSKSGLYESSVLEKVEIEQRIIATDVIFEAFGNAKTKKNSNSSRFGKVVSIQFEKNGKIKSGKVITTLFERTRLTQNRYMDRNYHILYQLVAAYQKIQDLQKFAEENQANVDYDIVKLVQEIQKLALDSEFILLGTQNSFLSSQDDQRKLEEDQKQTNEDFLQFQQLLLAFNDLDFSLEEIVNIFQCIAGLIHLKEDNYKKAEELLKIPNLNETINSNITTTRQSKKIQAESIINGIIMDFYYKLFIWIENRVNSNLSQNYDVNQKYILNIFDSFGFEIFENEFGIQQNQFEQLMLNYINEKLQNFYYSQIVDNTQKKFGSENLNLAPIDFQKNDKIITVIEDVIFKSLKDCILLSRSTQNLKDLIKKQTEEKSLQHILIDETQLKKKQGLLTQSQNAHKFEQNIICIRHTGGEIYYQLDSFISSNKYTVSQEIQSINQMSSNSIIKSFTQQSQNQTVADNTYKVINDIIQMFKKSETWFIKCFQTNYQQIPSSFDKIAMKTQLSQSGIEQCAQYLYQTYFLSIPKDEFFQTYQILEQNSQSIEDLKNILNQQFKDQIQYIHFGEKNILIKEQLKRDLDYKKEMIRQKQSQEHYKTMQRQRDDSQEIIQIQYQQEIERLNQTLQQKEKEAQYQKKRADYLEEQQQKTKKIIQDMKDSFSQCMEKLNQINLIYENQIQALNQAEQNNQSNGNNQVFGQIQ